MRLEKFNRLRSIGMTSAVVTTLIGIAGCKVQPKPVAQHPAMRPVVAGPDQTQPPVTQPATSPTTTQAATEPTTGPIIIPATGPAVIPSTLPTTTPLPTTAPVIQPASQPVTQPTSEPTSQPATQPAEPPIQNAVRPVKLPDISSDQTLAEQFAGIAELEFSTKVTNPAEWPSIWRYQAAILSASAELDPKEARFSRLAADAMAQAHDRKGEEEALRNAIVADRSDEFSYIRLMDLYLLDMPELNTRVDYLKGVVGNLATPPVPADVIAHAQYRLALELKDRGEDDAADAAIKQALRICPASVECLRLQYSWLSPEATAYQKAEELLALLKANPIQPAVSGQLADMISDAGLARDSLPFYRLAVQSSRGPGSFQHLMLGYAAAIFIDDPKEPKAASNNRTLLTFDPNFTPAYFLQLVLTKYSGDNDAYNKTMSEASNALGNRVVEAINKILPAEPNKPSTRPISDPEPLSLPDLAPAVVQLKQNGSEQLKEEFAEAVADLAFLQGYFAQKPEDAAKLIAALQVLLPDDSPELVRLQGWNDLLSNKPEEAKNKFLKVLDKDPLAQLGLVKILLTSTDPRQKMEAEGRARKLLADHPSGLMGALLFEQLHSDHVKFIPNNQAAALQTLVSAFPAPLFQAAEKPSSLYVVRITPKTVGTFFSDPVLAQVKIENVSSYDLTIGPDGFVKPELIFQMTPNLIKGQSSNFEAFDSVSGPTVLPAHVGSQQIVRLDQTQFLDFLDKQPNRLFPITCTVSTNRTVGGAGGVNAVLDKDFLRYASVLNPQNVDRALNDLVKGRPDQKISALNQLELFVLEMRQVVTKPGQVAPDSKPLLENIHRARSDTLQAVSAWAGKCDLELSSDPADKTSILNELADDSDWRHRQVALLLLSHTPPVIRDRILSALKDDPQSSVRAQARALQSRLSVPPATASTTRPTTIPATAPTTAPPNNP